MSADNWAPCPRCEIKREEFLKDLDANITLSYGLVSIAEFEASRRAYEVELEKELDETMREDYDIGIYEGEFSVNYRALCTVCGFTYKYEYDAKI